MDKPKKEMLQMIIFRGIQIIVFILVIFLNCYIWKKNKSKKAKLPHILILVLLLLPVGLNILFTYVPDKYFLYSYFKKEDWFSFIGGYAGTAIMGIVAYRQSDIQNRQQEQLSEMQTILTSLQLQPKIKVGEMKIYATTNSLKPAQSQSRLRHALFMGKSDCVMVNDLTREKKFVIIQIQLSNQGLVQMDKCILEEIQWTTEFFKYTIKLTGNREVFQNEESLYIVILPQDTIESVEDKRYNSEKDFFKDVVMHCEYEQHNIFYYAESVWEFFLTVVGGEQIGDSETEGKNQIDGNNAENKKENKINEGKPNNNGSVYHILYRSDSWHKYRDDDHNIILKIPVVRKVKNNENEEGNASENKGRDN